MISFLLHFSTAEIGDANKHMHVFVNWLLTSFTTPHITYTEDAHCQLMLEHITEYMCTQNASCVLYVCAGSSAWSHSLSVICCVCVSPLSCIKCVFCAHIYQTGVVSLSQVVQHRGFVEAGEVGHVLHFTEAWRVHPLHLLPRQSQLSLAVCELHLHLIAALFSDTGRLSGERGRSQTNKNGW